MVERAMAAGHRLHSVLVDDRRRPPVLSRVPPGIPIYAAGTAIRERLTGLGVQLDVIALFHRPNSSPDVDELLRESSRLVVLEGVDNPTNLGAIARSAAALGMDGILLDETGADPLATPIGRLGLDRSVRIAVLLGSERAGLGEDALSASRLRARIPMPAGIDSLNVGAAAAIACYALGPSLECT